MKQRAGLKVVYIIGNREHKQYKIGKSKNVNTRLKSLSRPPCPFKLELIATYPHGDDALLEKFLHNKFASKRMTAPNGGKDGEWFELTDQELLTVPIYVGEFNEQHPQKFEDMLVPEGPDLGLPKRIEFPKKKVDGWIARLRAKHETLLAELHETAFLLQAAEKYAKPLSDKKLDALKAARAGIGKKTEPEAGT
jgi:hypothetical protein